MAYSYQDYTATEGQKDFNVNIAFLAPEHIHVLIERVETKDWSWIGDATIELKDALTKGTFVRVQRITPRDELFIQYVKGAPFIRDNLDKQNTQFLYIAQEIAEGVILDNINNNLNMNMYRIINLANPTDGFDATNKQYVDKLVQELYAILNDISTAIIQSWVPRSSFEKGIVLRYRNEALLWEQNGQYYRWAGDFPKEVPAKSTPDSTGGVGIGKWLLVGDGALRTDLASTNGASLIGTTSGKTVQDELSTIGTYPKDLYFGTFFDNDAHPHLRLGVSLDGLNFSALLDLVTKDVQIDGRDPSCAYYNGVFYIAFSDTKPNEYDFSVYRSEDLLSWTKTHCTLGDKAICGTLFGEVEADQIWAPEIIIDKDGNFCIGISIQYYPDEQDINKQLIPKFANFVSKCIDVENLKFAEPEMIIFEKAHTSNKIDVCIVWDSVGNRYVLAIKNEYSKVIEVFQCHDLLGEYKFINNVPFEHRMEGPSIVAKKAGGFYIYADAYEDDLGVHAMQTQDFTSYEDEIDIFPLERTRHGSVTRTFGAPHAADYLTRVVGIGTIQRRSLKNISLDDHNGTTIDLTPLENTYYTVTGNNVVTVNLKKGAPTANFLVDSVSAGYLKLNGVQGFSGGLFLGNSSHSEGITQLELNKVGIYRTVNITPVFSSTSLAKDAGSNDINQDDITWYPKLGRIYITEGTDSTVNIYKLPTNINNGFYFYVCIRSGSAEGKIVFKQGGNIAVPGKDLVLAGNAGYDARLVRVEYSTNIWYVVY